MSIKNKTTLRNRILDNYHGTRTTDEYTRVVIDSDGDVNYYDQSVVCSDALTWKIRDFYCLLSMSESRAESSKMITKFFAVIDKMLSGKYPVASDLDYNLSTPEELNFKIHEV